MPGRLSDPDHPTPPGAPCMCGRRPLETLLATMLAMLVAVVPIRAGAGDPDFG